MFSYQSEPPEECFECLEKENRLDDIKYWFNGLIQLLYSPEELDLEEIEICLQELGGYVGIKIPIRPLQLMRQPKEDAISSLMSAWKQANNAYLKSLQLQH